jgi:hypothetical protein
MEHVAAFIKYKEVIMRRIMIIGFSILFAVFCIGGLGAAATVDLMVNGNFDSGPGAPWVEDAPAPVCLICASATLPVVPHTLDYAVWLGGVSGWSDSVYQVIAIPAGATNLTLSLYRQTESSDSTSVPNDFAYLMVEEITVGAWSNMNTTTGWTQHSFPISDSFAGTNILVSLQSTNDSSLATHFFFDTMALNAELVPIPSAVWLLGSGIIGLFGIRRKFKS